MLKNLRYTHQAFSIYTPDGELDPARSYFSEHAVHHLHGLVYAHMKPALG